MPADFLFRQITNERGYGYSTFSYNNQLSVITSDFEKLEMEDFYYGIQ